MQKRLLRVVFLASVGALGLVACGDDSSQSSTDGGQESGPADSGRSDADSGSRGGGGSEAGLGGGGSEAGLGGSGGSEAGSGLGGSEAGLGGGGTGGVGGADAGSAGGQAGADAAPTDSGAEADATANDASDSGQDVGTGDVGTDGTLPDAAPDAGGDTGPTEAGGDSQPDAGLSIAWSAFLPLAGGTVVDGGANTSVDITGHGYDATYTSDVTFANSAMVFGSSGTRLVSIPPKSTVPVVDLTGSYSVSVWAKMANTGGYRTFVSADGNNVSEFYLQKRGDSDNRLAFTLSLSDSNGGVSSPCIAAASGTPTANTLYHLVATRDASTGTNTLYVDGVEAGHTTCLSSTGAGWAANTIGIGHGMYSGNKVDQLDGSVAGLGIVNRVLSSTEVAALYARGVGYNPSNP